ncbi:7-carboxy-7-deazaguanine synthase [Hypnocyclicus thermotrophus]|uniref:7-carboxy-7-deazaguanine synthase n=1 Tax=Hypnocyclicus thermotrophus TaxID=1627895 RepID=A0AA46DXI3_9FUSO|nr:putative 7-carboxy-7-deazaguanine synthase QueE [Hypnocyclicus thermotrophus]TDT68090.1 7-carboxy-7-deazaguanine synthase [Hypnocyclicus thermotrophus]
MKQYKIVEKFISINGEGQRAGEISLFIRFPSCNLKCTYCDTMWANEKNVNTIYITIEDIKNDINMYNIKNITLTGGEPLLQDDISVVIQEILSINNKINIEIETNGSIDLSKLEKINRERVYITMDYKLPTSKMEGLMKIENFDKLTHKDTIKFVIGSNYDLIRAKNIIKNYIKEGKVYFSPVFKEIEPKYIVEFMKEHKLTDVRLQLQMHKIIWNPDERGV